MIRDNLKTEEEARETWCPDAQVMGAEPTAGNRLWHYERLPEHSNCLASKCMAWRWARRADRGYCGRAGTPY